MKKILLSIAFSITLHTAALLAVRHVDRDHGVWKLVFETIDLPANLWIFLIWGGHGIAQLVMPFIFSLVFYAAAFWLLFTCIERLRRKKRDGAGGPKEGGKKTGYFTP